MAITWQTPGSLSYAGPSVSNLNVAVPASVAAGEMLICITAQKPLTANGGGMTTPSGWTLVTSLTGANDGDTGGYGTTLGADTGNTNIYAYKKIAVGSESGTITWALTDHDVAWGQMFRLTAGSGNWDSVAGTTGKDTVGGSVSITFAADPGVTAADLVIGGMSIASDVTTPNQFSSEAFSQNGITFGSVSEISEPDRSSGNDIAGFLCYSIVSSGTSSAAPVMTATAGGTTTNVRGPGVFVRIREAAATFVSNPTLMLMGAG